MTSTEVLRGFENERLLWKRLNYASMYRTDKTLLNELFSKAIDGSYGEETNPVTMTVNSRLSLECVAQMMASGGRRTVWKKLHFTEGRAWDYTRDKHDPHLVSPYHGKFRWEPGWLEAGGNQQDHADHLIVYDGQVIAEAAIHTYFNKPKWMADDRSWYAVFVPVMAHVDDFIGAGAIDRHRENVEATFRRVYLTHADCELAVKCALERKGKAPSDHWYPNDTSFDTNALDTREMQRQALNALAGYKK